MSDGLTDRRGQDESPAVGQPVSKYGLEFLYVETANKISSAIVDTFSKRIIYYTPLGNMTLDQLKVLGEMLQEVISDVVQEEVELFHGNVGADHE